MFNFGKKARKPNMQDAWKSSGECSMDLLPIPCLLLVPLRLLLSPIQFWECQKEMQCSTGIPCCLGQMSQVNSPKTMFQLKTPAVARGCLTDKVHDMVEQVACSMDGGLMSKEPVTTQSLKLQNQWTSWCCHGHGRSSKTRKSFSRYEYRRSIKTTTIVHGNESPPVTN